MSRIVNVFLLLEVNSVAPACVKQTGLLFTGAYKFVWF